MNSYCAECNKFIIPGSEVSEMCENPILFSGLGPRLDSNDVEVNREGWLQ